MYNISYINTSIEDYTDISLGSSIYVQQKTIIDIFEEFKKNNKIKSNILIEFGQNPGLIQHYILYSLNYLNKIKNNSDIDNYDIDILIKTIDEYKIGMILISEIDNIYKKDDDNLLEKDKVYNTWCVSGMISESFDKCELVYGKKNKFIKPKILKNMINMEKNKFVDDYQILFLKNKGYDCHLHSICPILINNVINFITYEGKLIHHGEIFELAKLFGNKAPFMSYVYKINKYAEKTIKDIFENKFNSNEEKFVNYINNDCNSNTVINNFKEQYEGFDSIGCTIFCGKKNIEKIYWCGSILNHTDNNVNKYFTSTIIQVAAGVLSGLSYIMEKSNKKKGLMMSCDLDTVYILKKAMPLLGQFFITEIDKRKFNNDLYLKVKK